VQATLPQNQIPLACLDFLKNGFDFKNFDFDVAVNYCRVDRLLLAMTVFKTAPYTNFNL
jgi:hypothetical protein